MKSYRRNYWSHLIFYLFIAILAAVFYYFSGQIEKLKEENQNLIQNKLELEEQIEWLNDQMVRIRSI